MPLYWVGGFRIRTETPVALWRDHLLRGGEADLDIREGEVPFLDEAARRRPPWELDTGEGFLCRLPGLVRMLATGGRTITFQIEGGGRAGAGDPLERAPHLALGYLRRPVVMQRGGVGLHASSVLFRTGAVAFCAPSGTGKSTLAAAFMRGGRQILSDDLCVVVPAAGGWRVIPHGSGLRLRRAAAARLQLPVVCRRASGKAVLSMPAAPPGLAPALRAIVFLDRGELEGWSLPQPLAPDAVRDRLDAFMWRPSIFPSVLDCRDDLETSHRHRLAADLSKTAGFSFSLPDRWHRYDEVVSGLEGFLDALGDR